MPIISQRITIIRSRKPVHRDLNEELQWFGSSLGLFNLRDKDKSCFRIFIEMIKSSKHRKPLTSDEIANKLDLSRGTVVHHLHKLVDSGLVISERNTYLLRVDNLGSLIDEVIKDVQRAMEDLKEVASEIDKRLGL